MDKGWLHSGMRAGEWITGRTAIDLAFPSFSEVQKQELADLAESDAKVRVTSVEATTISFAPATPTRGE